MAKEWTDDEVQQEINAAIRIAREDGILREMRGLRDKLSKHFPDEPPNGNSGDPANGDPNGSTEPKEGDPPPKGDPKTSNAEPKKRRSLWWGEQSEGEPK